MISGIVRKLGKELFADIRISEECSDFLKDEDKLSELLTKSFEDAGIRIVVDKAGKKKVLIHDFTDETGVDDDGVTYTTIFGESHGTASTWPAKFDEKGKKLNSSCILLNIFTCGIDLSKPYKAFGNVAAALNSEIMLVRAFDRGEPG